MVIYVPGTEERDPKKQNISLQQLAAASYDIITDVATNTAAIATNASSVRSVATGGTGVAAIPSFQARRGSADQTGVVTATFTKIELNTEEWDTGSYFDNATNYRYTPLIAGTYQVNAAVTMLTIAAGVTLIIEVRKNGSAFKRGRVVNGGLNTASVALSCLVQLNGSTDYIEFFAYHESGANRDIRGDNTTETYASAVWVGP